MVSEMVYGLWWEILFVDNIGNHEADIYKNLDLSN